MNVLCLVMDRLHVNYLGAHGNAWVGTPEFDRLASRGYLFDQALIDSPRLEALYHGLWQGWHALRGEPPGMVATGLAGLLAAREIETTLVSDEPAVAGHPLAQAFGGRIDLPPAEADRCAVSIDQTHLAACFAELIDHLHSAQPPFLLWCHLGSLGQTWDAPLEFRQRYTEEGDPEPSDSAVVPSRSLPSDHDPDEVLTVSQSYAGQIALWDVCLGALTEALAETPYGRETLLVVLGARGMPLGEHGWIGPAEEPLHSPLAQIPWLLSFPDGQAAGARTHALVQTPDLYATFLDVFQVAPPQSPTGSRSVLPLVREDVWTLHDRLVVAGPSGQRAIRTAAWYLLDHGQRAELYAKPDDHWEANDVAIRCPNETEALRRALADTTAALEADTIDQLPPLEDGL